MFFGDLGSCSSHLISYFENIGCRPINSGENPSTWMLNVINEKITVKGENGGDLDVHLDFANEYKKSSNYKKLQQRLIDLSDNRDEKLHIKYENQFAASRRDRDTLMAHRLVTIYWRSPAYNLSRMVCIVSSFMMC